MSPSTQSLPHQVQLSPLYFLERAAAVYPQKDAIVYGTTTYSYQEFARTAESLARIIRETINPGDRVAVLAPNIPEMLIAHFAVPLAGGVLVALNTRLSADEIRYILEHSGARMLFVDSEWSGLVAQAAAGIPEIVEIIEIADESVGNGYGATKLAATRYDRFLARAQELDQSPLEWSVDDEQSLISINYTSGTTGSPKGVMYTHRGAQINSMGAVHHNSYTTDTRFLWTLPMFHCNGWCATWAVTAAAGLHICLRAMREQPVWEAIDKYEVSHLCGAPTVCSTISEAPQAHPFSHEMRIITGGAPPSPTMISKLEDLGATVIHGYGLTEVYGPYTTCEYQSSWDGLTRDSRAANMARQGVGMIQAGIPRVVNEDMTDVPADGETLGEIVMRGNNVTIGYFRDEEATARAFAGGWFHSGDLGVMHPDGYIELKDRAKDLIISGGENISSIEVENAILTLSAVVDAAVIGATHEKWGNVPSVTS